MPLSMTGFARTEQQEVWGLLSCEIRSVNHRYLDLSFKCPETLRSIEPNLREKVKKVLHRGKVEVSLYLRTDTNSDQELALNTELAAHIAQLAEQASNNLKNPAAINPLDILKWPGVIKASEIDSDALTHVAHALFTETLKGLHENRMREGQELAQFIEQRLLAIDEHVKHIQTILPKILAHHKDKLNEKLAVLQVDVDSDRLAQELVYLAQKSDVAEELDRLLAHLAEVRRTLKQKGPVGRRLDFLMQELNREANTLSSKSIDSETTTSAVELKVLIEQMREQIQNIE